MTPGPLPDWRRRPGAATGAMVLAVLSAVSLGPLGALIGVASLGFDQPAGAAAGLLAAAAAVLALVGVLRLRDGRAWWPLVTGCAVLVLLVLLWIGYGFSVRSGDSSGGFLVLAACPAGATALGSLSAVRTWVAQTGAAGPG